MTVVTVERAIAAPAAVVFHAISDIEGLPQVSAAVQSVEFIGAQREGIGTRFKEVRAMGGTSLVTELEVRAYDPDAHVVRMVADTHGTIWDTTMSVRAEGSGSVLEIAMTAIGSTWRKRFMNWLMQGMFRRGMRTHLEELAAHCERAGVVR